MKHLIPLILTLLILCGCAAAPAESETTPPPTEPEVTEAPAGIYDPGSALEAASGGAVQVYPLDLSDCRAVVPMGSDLLVFSGTEQTKLTKFSGDALSLTAQTQLDCTISPDDAATQISEKGLTYFDSAKLEVVFLDASLKEVNRVSLPEDIQGKPAMSADRKKLYYCSEDALRTIDLDTGLNKLLKSQQHLTLLGLHTDDTIIACQTSGGQMIYIDVQNGQSVYETNLDIQLTTWGDSYFAIRPEGAFYQMLTGQNGQEPLALHAGSYESVITIVPELNGVVLHSSADEAVLDFYDLSSGLHTASLALPTENTPIDICAGTENVLWLLGYSAEHTRYALFRWDLAKSAANDETVYTGAPYTAAAPDSAALAACETLAQQIGQKHHVEILFRLPDGEYPPAGFILEPEFHAPLLQTCLEVLDAALTQYPEGFLKETASMTDSEILRICLVRSISAESDGAGLPGMQYWDKDGNACIIVTAEPALEQPLHHSLFHVIESRVMSDCSAYDDWEELNPTGFEYAYDYTVNPQPEDAAQYTEGSDRAFIDRYAMSFPKEDRARIFEYAMTESADDIFTHPKLQQKLQQLCMGIREAYKLESYEEDLPWELYLTKSLVSHG